MWDCPNCGCQAIAHDLEFCPVCRIPRGEATAPKGRTPSSKSSSKAGKEPE